MASLTEEEIRDRASDASAPSGGADGTPGLARRMPDSLSRLLANFRSFLARGRFSSLTRRIVAFNVAAIFVLLSGILYLNQFREGLIDARRQSLLVQAEIIANAIGQGATAAPGATVIDPLAAGHILAPPPGDSSDAVIQEDVLINPETAAPILRRLVLPTRTRARLYGKEGWLILDSRQLSASGQIVAFELPPPEDADEGSVIDRFLQWGRSLLPGRNLERFREAGSQNGTMYDEVVAALSGMASSKERVNDRGELIVSVAVPIQRYRAVLGVLMLSTRGGDIDRIVRAERIAILQVFLVALGVTILLSVLLAATIAEPVRRLAQAAEAVRRGKNARAQIPDFTGRRDEIGDLSGAIRDMTNALYNRIDAIESFAADVAHEIKNPLTSLRSAIETFRLAKDEKQKDRLMEIIQDDVRRIDRLISDISNASRLDAELSRSELEDVNVATLLETVSDLFNETGVAGSARVKLDIDPGAPGREGMVVKGFDNRLGQVMRNLIDNALSFSPKGGTVHVTASRAPGRIVIRVDDEGPGIEPENFERIFDRFHTDRPDSFGEHSGLGLAISRQIIEAHGGTIRADNRMKDGKVMGACFTVELPEAV
ncbi:sensor histidine kinase [Parvibaculum sp.]|uniref:sensor histidine kinase n=1 Tax=Parvibaculum sp. TaxID=2024848 RepID=UPI000C56A0A6|nr:sensor histidine kinase [Parvibaculum sp.]MAM94461.1 histidine kinase [Parvibaculum sp.]|tara:strand:- start:29621 stop:31423 length:1803 start_codon:yes stop_codon:yes gene_type:complete